MYKIDSQWDDLCNKVEVLIGPCAKGVPKNYCKSDDLRAKGLRCNYFCKQGYLSITGSYTIGKSTN